MIKVPVPTKVFSSMSRNTVKTTSIIIQPPVPTKPVPKPMVKPKKRNLRRFQGGSARSAIEPRSPTGCRRSFSGSYVWHRKQTGCKEKWMYEGYINYFSVIFLPKIQTRPYIHLHWYQPALTALLYFQRRLLLCIRCRG